METKRLLVVFTVHVRNRMFYCENRIVRVRKKEIGRINRFRREETKIISIQKGK